MIKQVKLKENEMQSAGQVATTIESMAHELSKLKVTTNAELRKAGIENGSKGVKGAFLLYGFVFVVNAIYAHANNGGRLLDPLQLVLLAGLLCVALLAYFGFIFSYTVSAKLENGNPSIVTRADHVQSE